MLVVVGAVIVIVAIVAIVVACVVSKFPVLDAFGHFQTNLGR